MQKERNKEKKKMQQYVLVDISDALVFHDKDQIEARQDRLKDCVGNESRGKPGISKSNNNNTTTRYTRTC